MNAEGPALFEFHPPLAERIPWARLGHGATPLEAHTLTTESGPRRVLVKRDDLSGSPYGGNKVRKLEFILAAAEQRGARRLITAGAAGSHHALATALYGRARGFSVTLVLFPQSLNEHVRDILLMDFAAGAQLRWVPRMEMVPIGVASARMRYWQERPLIIAPGGSDAVGTLGYVSAGLELAAQLTTSTLPRPSAVHVAAGTLGTAAGLALGLALAGVDLPVRATRITSRIVANERALRALIAGASELLRNAGLAVPDPDVVASRVELRHKHIGRGYGRETDEGQRATRIFSDAGLRLDPTYTAKAAADMLDSDESEPPLFLLTLSGSEPLASTSAVRPEMLPSAFRRYLGA